MRVHVYEVVTMTMKVKMEVYGATVWDWTPHVALGSIPHCSTIYFHFHFNCHCHYLANMYMYFHLSVSIHYQSHVALGSIPQCSNLNLVLHYLSQLQTSIAKGPLFLYISSIVATLLMKRINKSIGEKVSHYLSFASQLKLFIITTTINHAPLVINIL